jgi:hypothetical protein
MIVRQRSIGRWYRRANRSGVHHAPMFGRILAICGWLAMSVRRPFGGPLSAVRPWAPIVVAALLLVLAALPIVVPVLQAQPEDVTVQQILDNAVSEPNGWVRLQGRVVPLTESPTGEPGDYGLLVDEADTLQAIVVRSDGQVTRAESTTVTGHLTGAIVAVEEELPLEATVFGAPPAIVPHLVMQLDAAALPERVTWWPLSILPLLLAAALIVGAWAGYPVFRPTSEVDVVSSPLAPGERVPTAFAGRLGPTVRELSDPGAAVIVVRPGPAGNVLTAQPLSDDERPAPPPVPIGGGGSRGRIGWVYTVSEAVPALRLRAESVDATLLFAKTGERDRVAGLVAVDRG